MRARVCPLAVVTIVVTVASALLAAPSAVAAAPGTAKRYVLHPRAANVRGSVSQTFTLTVAHP